MEEKEFKVLAINGSPRGQKGLTDIIIRRFLKGAEDAGAQTDVVYLGSLDIKHCRGCLTCWFRTPGVCVHKDDMRGLVEKFEGVSVMVLASPVYVDGMTGQMKTMFDRMVAYAQPFFEFDGDRTYHPKVGDEGLKVVAISTCGFPEREHFQAIALHFKRICANMRAELLGEFYFPGSSSLASDPALVEPNLRAVERAGREAVGSGAIAPETIEVANLDYIDDLRAFGESINELFHVIRRQHGAE